MYCVKLFNKTGFIKIAESLITLLRNELNTAKNYFGNSKRTNKAYSYFHIFNFSNLHVSIKNPRKMIFQMMAHGISE